MFKKLLAPVIAVISFGVGGAIAFHSTTTATSQATTGLVSVSPTRILDTRTTAKLGTSSAVTVKSGIAGASAVAVNITITDNDAAGFVTAWAGGARPDTSIINTFGPNQTLANYAILPVAEDGTFMLYSSQPANLIVDLMGYFTTLTSPIPTTTVANVALTTIASQSQVPLGIPPLTLPAISVPAITLPPLSVPPLTLPSPSSSSTTTPRTTVPPVTTTTPTTTVPASTVPASTVPASTVPPSTTVASSSACGLVNAAFCETFDAPTANGSASRSGDLNALFWGVSRVNTAFNFTQGQANDWGDSTLLGCGAAQTVNAPSDAQICNGTVHESVADGHGQSTLAMYPKQPFDIAGSRAGTAVFDVSADSEGEHAAWPEFWWTDQPVPAAHGHLAANDTYARNSFGFSIDGQCTGDVPSQVGTHEPYVGIAAMHITTNYVLSDVAMTQVGCVLKGSLTSLNHFEVRFNINGHTAEVWGSDPGGSHLHMIAYTAAVLPLTRGVIWMEDVHYNADKFDTQADHTFAWDNVGFDGPKLYRDLTFDVPDAHTACATTGCQQLGRYVYQTPVPMTVRGVNWQQTPTASYVAFTWSPLDPLMPDVRVNGGAWQTLPWMGGPTYTNRTVAIPIIFADVRTGDNVIEFRYGVNQTTAFNGGTVVSDVNLILIAATPVP